MADGPTPRQAEYLAFIRAFTDRRGIPPSFEEIGQHFLTTTPSVNGMVKTLERRGFLTRVPGAPRTLRVLVPVDRAPSIARGAGGRPDDIGHALAVTTLVVERLVPALKGLPDDDVHRALDAVLAALDVACVAAGASDARRREVSESLRRVTIVALGRPLAGRHRR